MKRAKKAWPFLRDFHLLSTFSLFTSKLWNGRRKLDLLASFSFTIVSWQYLLVNGGTGTKGLTFQRDFHLLIFWWYLLVNGGTGQVARFSFTSVLMIFTRKLWNGRRRLDRLARFSAVFLRIQVRPSSQTKGLERGWKRWTRLGRELPFLSTHTRSRASRA